MWCPFANSVPLDARQAYRKDMTAGVLGAIMSGLYGPFVAIIARKTLHANAFEIGVLSMAPVAGNLFSLVWANITEGRRKMPFAKWSWVAARSLLLLMVLATEAWSFVAILAAMNFVSSIALPAYSALMKEIYPDSDRARIMGYARVCMISSYVLVIAIASPLLTVASYRYVFPVAAMFGIVGAFVFSRIPAGKAAGDPDVSLPRFIRGGFRIMREDSGFKWFCTGISIFGMANFLAAPACTIYQVRIGVDTTWAGVYSIVSALTMTVAYIYWGGYTDRRRPEAVAAVQILVSALIPVTYCFATEPWMLLPATLIGGITNAGLELTYLTGVLHFAPEDRITQYQAVFLSLMGLCGIVAPFVGAALLDSGLMSARAIFVLSALAVVLGALIQVLGMRGRHTPLSSQERGRGVR